MKVFVLIVTILITAEAKLYQVVSLTRHGARYHVNDFGDGIETKPLWGQLTAVGMRQHQRLGQLFRQQYIDSLKFLSPTYNSSEIQNNAEHTVPIIWVYPLETGPRLTLVNRTYHLPPYSNKTDIQQQNYALPSAFQPIKVKQSAKVMLMDCPNSGAYTKYNLELNANLVKEMNQTYYPFFQRMAPMFNFSLKTVTLYTMLRCLDVVNVDSYLGRPLPNNFTEDDRKNLFHLANWYYYIAQLGNNSLVYNTGKLQKIISVFDLRTKLPDTYALKWTFLSGHDTDIMAMHLGLNLSSAQCIEEIYRKGNTTALNCEDGANYFASNLIFQLHSDDSKAFYVKIRSNGKYVKLCGKNSTQCDYTQWKNAAKKNIVTTNLEALCGKPITGDEIQTQTPSVKFRSPVLLQM